MDIDRVLAVLRAFGEHQAEYVLVGAVALNLHGLVRATEDLDVFVRADASNVERIKRALRAVWDDPSIDDITAEDLAGQYPVVRYGPPSEDFVIDLMSRLGDAISFDDLAYDEVDFAGVSVRLATPTTLYAMKRDTVRPQDRADAAVLKERFGLEREDAEEEGARG